VDINPLSTIVFICGALTLALAGYSWQRRSANSAREFSVCMTAVAIYVIGYGFELSSLNLETMLFWSRIEYVGILSFPTLFLVFTIQYTGHEKWLNLRNGILLSILPVSLLVFKLLDNSLHLIYSSVAVDASGEFPMLAFSRGPLYLVIAIYGLTLFAISYGLLVQKWRSSSALYRQQTQAMVITISIIYLVYLLYVIGIPFFPEMKHLDINPFLYTFWGVVIFRTMFRHRLFDLAPIARDALIERLSDGVVVMDTQARIVDANPEALKIFDWPAVPAGKNVAESIGEWIDLRFLRAPERPAKVETRIARGEIVRHYEISISDLQEKNRVTAGYLILVHDITERIQVENELKELSLVDELTGLTNRRGFKMLGNQLLMMAQRMEYNLGLYYIDMDNLKWVNDVLGHAEGDKALKEIGDILRQTFRSADIIARVGGDEFVVLSVISDDHSIPTMMDRLNARVEISNKALPDYQIGFSVGVAVFSPENPRTMESLLEEADRDMYVKKAAKKGVRSPSLKNPIRPPGN